MTPALSPLSVWSTHSRTAVRTPSADCSVCVPTTVPTTTVAAACAARSIGMGSRVVATARGGQAIATAAQATANAAHNRRSVRTSRPAKGLWREGAWVNTTCAPICREQERSQPYAESRERTTTRTGGQHGVASDRRRPAVSRWMRAQSGALERGEARATWALQSSALRSVQGRQKAGGPALILKGPAVTTCATSGSLTASPPRIALRSSGCPCRHRPSRSGWGRCSRHPTARRRTPHRRLR